MQESLYVCVPTSPRARTHKQTHSLCASDCMCACVCVCVCVCMMSHDVSMCISSLLANMTDVNYSMFVTLQHCWLQMYDEVCMRCYVVNGVYYIVVRSVMCV